MPLRLLIAFVLIGLNVNIFAQKLPNVQKVSIYAPPNVKIDGEVDEWNNQFQAYNRTTEIFYTIANDDDNIYLSLKATKSSIIEKMMEGGIGFTINGSVKNNEDKNITVLFPLMAMSKCRQILLSAGKKLNAGNYTLHTPVPADTIYISRLAASVLKANAELAENLKEIKILGIPSVIDTIAGVTDKTPYYSNLPLRDHHYKIIAVNNQDNIKAITRFDDAGSLICEISIPVKYVQQTNQGLKKISYNIIVHGRGEDRRPGDTIWYGPLIDGKKEILYLDLETPTDFSGEYTLAKKQ